jgi:hypothetical protein
MWYIMSEEIQMYRCLTFSYAVKYGFITIDYERNSVEIPLRNLTDDKTLEITLKLRKQAISQIDPDLGYLIPYTVPGVDCI